MSSIDKAYATGMFVGGVYGISSVYLTFGLYVIVSLCTAVIGTYVMVKIRGEE